MQQNVTLLKFGGGLIAPKDWETETPDMNVITRLCKEIAAAKEKTEDKFVLTVGQGNYAHKPAARYRTANGFQDSDKESKWGACYTQWVAAKINMLVTGELLKCGLRAAIIMPHDIWISKKGGLKSEFSEVIEELIYKDIIPVLHGDVIWDTKNGCVIYSGDTDLKLLVPVVQRNGKVIKKIVQVSREEGVWNNERKVIPEINQDNWTRYKKEVGGAAGTDVTGGMFHKVEECLEIAKQHNVKTIILSGKVEGRLEKALRGENVQGTVIAG